MGTYRTPTGAFLLASKAKKIPKPILHQTPEQRQKRQERSRPHGHQTRTQDQSLPKNHMHPQLEKILQEHHETAQRAKPQSAPAPRNVGEQRRQSSQG